MVVLLSVGTVLLIFMFGFYLGNQIGNSAHIRNELTQARANNTVRGLHHLKK